jgi:ribosomal RNA-processing protein 17
MGLKRSLAEKKGKGGKNLGRKDKPYKLNPKKITEYVAFDEKKRNDFVTGFHKRKMEIKKEKFGKYQQHLLDEKREKRREKESKVRSQIKQVKQIDAIQRKSDKVFESQDMKITVTVEELV